MRVRLIVDAVGSFGLGRDYFDELVAANGAMRWFNEQRLAYWFFARLDPELAALKLQRGTSAKTGLCDA